MSIGSLDRQLFLAGEEITDLTESVSVGTVSYPEWGSMPVSSPASFRVASNGLDFRPWNPVSLVYGLKNRDIALELLQGGNVRWTGTLEDLTTDPGAYRASLRGETRLTRAINRNGRVDTDELTPAEAAERLLNLQGVATDSASFARAAAILQALPVRVRVRPDVVNWQGTTGDILQLLCNAGLLRMGIGPDGAVRCQAWQDDTEPPGIASITDDLIQSWPQTEAIQFQPLDGYSITNLYFVDSFNAEADNVLSFDFGPNSAVQMVDAIASTYCGSQWIALHSKEWIRVRVHVDRAFGLSIINDDWIQLDSASLGVDAPMQVDGYDDSDARWITIIGRMDKNAIGGL